MRAFRRFSRSDYEYELPPVMIAVYRHPRTRRIHRLTECRAMKYQGQRPLEPLLLQNDRISEAGELCQFCFGS